MNKAIRIFGETLTEAYNWRTTEKLMKVLRKEAETKGCSVNTLLNSIIYDRYYNKK